MKIRKCKKCGIYTMKKICCRSETTLAHPVKYHPEDKYAKYRRKEEEENEEKK